MVASVASAYPYSHDKLIVTGQGIDTDLFSPKIDVPPESPPMILCVGRLSPVKDHPTLLKAFWRLQKDDNAAFRLVILGGPATFHDADYVLQLHQRVKQLGLEATVHFEPTVSMQTLPLWYRRCSVYVNMTPTGSGDKVVWEAMACAKPAVVANEGFKETLGDYADRLLFTYGNAEELAERLRFVLALSSIARVSMGAYLRERVVAMHSLSRLSGNLVKIFSNQCLRSGEGQSRTVQEWRR
jgi:glycosyltransferase involved in cell wall biosynthesis